MTVLTHKTFFLAIRSGTLYRQCLSRFSSTLPFPKAVTGDEGVWPSGGPPHSLLGVSVNLSILYLGGRRMTDSVTSKRLQKILDGLLNTQDLMRAFDKSAMTIFLWRTRKGLPHVIVRGDSRPTIRYRKPDVIDWAHRNGKTPRFAGAAALTGTHPRKRAVP